MDAVLVGRQPIFDPEAHVRGYELLFRPAEAEGVPGAFDGERATAAVILNTFVELGPERVVGDRLAFLNLGRTYLVEGSSSLPMDPGRTVLEILEDVPADPEVLAGIRALKDRGFRMALDDYAGQPALEPFLDLVDFVKVECPALPPDELERLVERLRRRDVQLLAEKIESQEEYGRYRDLGFDLYQGYYLMRPSIVRGRGVPQNRVSLLRVLARLQDPDLELEELEELVGHDVGLTFRLLRHVNSALYGLRRQVDSARDAIVYVGLERLRAIVALLVLASVQDKPREVFRTAVVRGKTCELLGERLQPGRGSTYFTAGMLSLLDALLDVDLETLLEELPLTRELADALRGEQGGSLGAVLQSVRAHERGEWERVALPGVGARQLVADYLAAIEFSRGVDRDLPRAA